MRHLLAAIYALVRRRCTQLHREREVFTIVADTKRPFMSKNKNQRAASPSVLDKARDELYNHILRCGVIGAQNDHQKEWFDDTIEYMAERYPTLSEAQVNDLRQLGERYCQPVIQQPPVGATS